ncbi:hypothetical protein EON83_17775 [bacterium]|nr:MAG: hypothetical protein EON83_17775 [bacterium]
MKPLIPLVCSLALFGCLANAQTQTLPPNAAVAATALKTGEIALEGEIKAINGATGEITILATAFATPNGSKTLAEAKSKTLITTASTLFVDRRLGSAYSISDLESGLKVRVVGRDGGTGQPMRARILEWLSKESPFPADPDSPTTLNGLLPPPQDFRGVELRVIDGGFQPENHIFDWSKNRRPVFFIKYRVSAPPTVKKERPLYEWGNLKEVKAPDGTSIYSSGAGSNTTAAGESYTRSFPRVNPQWKSVTTMWEVTSPEAGPNSNGRFKGQFQLAGDLPTREKPTSEPKTRLETPHGTVFTLQSITCDWEKKISTYVLSVEKPDDVSSPRVDTMLAGLTDEKNRNLKPGPSRQHATETQVTFSIPAVPEEGAKEAHLSLDVTEQAEAWKQKDAYKTVEMELPVAALLKANPPASVSETELEGTLPSWTAQNEMFSARIEETQPGDSLLGLLWVAPRLKPDTDEVRTLVETIAVPVGLSALNADGQKREVIFAGAESDENFFHSDGSQPTVGETVRHFNSDAGQTFGDETAFSLSVQSFKRLKSDVNLKNLVVAAGKERIVDEPTGNGNLLLKKVALVDEDATAKLLERAKGMLHFGGKKCLVLVFNRTPIARDAKVVVDSVTLRDDKGTTQTNQWNTCLWQGDALTGAANDSLTVVLPTPSEGTKSVDVRVRFTESGPVENESTLEFPAIKWQKYKQ